MVTLTFLMAGTIDALSCLQVLSSSSHAVGCSLPPPAWLTQGLSRALRTRLGLQLFNYDMICPADQSQEGECLFLVIDINYFPGVDKIPDFESLFVDFLLAACKGEDVEGGLEEQPHALGQQATEH